MEYEERFSDSPYIDRVWRTRSTQDGNVISIALCALDIVIWKQQRNTYFSLQGPETHARLFPIPENAEFFGIMLKVGCHMPHIPVPQLINSAAELPGATANSFWLKGAAWEYPTYDNVEVFVDRLVRQSLLVHEPMVTALLCGHQPNLSVRTLQRRFVQTTGLSKSTIQQIERARHATILLKSGVSILDTVHETGYFDQPHLTRALSHYIGQTPRQLMDRQNPAQLSFLYKTCTTG